MSFCSSLDDEDRVLKKKKKPSMYFVEVRGQPSGVDFPPPPCRLQGVNLGHQAWQQVLKHLTYPGLESLTAKLYNKVLIFLISMKSLKEVNS